ncbi:hypothetical protein L249_2252 [Ophiocordyceps polyrhachis-furcata BCC 54312]|uniref:EF-hand domain-containing protein n=1 Tax=Ophiocordyceps polyrhachis-furcata BCC 54312 TaxID=1330021 RepID=A0A367LQ23_9HYPO|nr:hypothetical protein L249_2252 [Ophiocordyceps polyrhachis-furcata BCC 54312]
MTNNKRQSITSGFIPLSGGDVMADAAIPLSTVRSHASTTGARKPNPLAMTSSYDPAADEKAHFRPRHKGRRRKTSDGLGRTGTGSTEDVSVNALGKIYNRIVGFSVVTRYLVYVVPVGLLLAAPLIILALTGNKNAVPLGSKRPEQGGREIPGPPLFALFLWIEISWLCLWAAKTAAWLLPKVFIFFCGIVSMGVRKYATVLRNLNIPLSFFFSAMASWITFRRLFVDATNTGIDWAVTFERVLAALFASTAVLLAEKALVQLIGVSYHQRSFANRIKASKREIHLMGLLYDASRTLFPMYCPEFADEDYVINDSIDVMLRSKAGNKSTGAATPMRIIGDVGRLGDKVTHAVGNIAHEITGKQVLNPNSAHSIVLEALEKRRPSEALGRRIWMSFVLEGKDALYPDDFHEVLGPAYRNEADEAFDAIDGDMNGDISLEEMMRKVVEIGRERKTIGEGMKDIGQALRVLDKVLLFVVVLIVIFIFFFFLDNSTLKVIGSAGAALLSLSFVFAVTTQEFLGSCIFLFVKHPYDVGDRVDISKVQMVVERISLLYTVFTRIDLMQVVQVPNIQLNNLWIDNISRSKSMQETIELNVSYDTSFEDIELLRLEMEQFVRSPDNSRDFQPDFKISVGGVGDLDKMVLYISIKHKSNWHNDTVRAMRRSKFMCALALALKKVPINGPGGGDDALGGPKNPSYSVAVTDEFASAARQESAKDKDAARLVPTNADQTESEQREAEVQAAAELNTRSAMQTMQDPWDARNRSDNASLSSGRRSKDIESIRTELIKRASTRGRRKAGDGLQSMARAPTAESGNFYPASSPVHGPGAGSRLEPFDEEAQMGISFPSRTDDARMGTMPLPPRSDETQRANMMYQARSEDEDHPLPDEEQQSLHPSASQHSTQRGLHRGPSMAYQGGRSLTPSGRH